MHIVDSGQAQHHRLGRFRFTRLGVGLCEQGAALREVASAPSIGEHAVVAQPNGDTRKVSDLAVLLKSERLCSGEKITPLFVDY